VTFANTHEGSLVPRPLPPPLPLFGGEWPGDEANMKEAMANEYRERSPAVKIK